MNHFDFSGTWKSYYLLSNIVANIRQSNSTIEGVVCVYSFLGKKDVYHVTGVAKGTSIHAWHHNGKSFKGNATSGHIVSGVVTTEKGNVLHIKAKRVSLKPASP